MMLMVGKQFGMYKTLADAIDGIPGDYKERVELHLEPGIYDENIVIERDNTALIGNTAENTIIRGSLYAKEIMPDGTLRGTFRTATIRTDGDHISLKNVTIENTAGPGSIYGQAVALYADGDNIEVDSCRLLAHQDTLFTAPLPPTNKKGKNSGFGPKQYAPRRSQRHVYRKCFIQGDVDFIFGGAIALFEDCIIYSKKGEVKHTTDTTRPEGYVTAPCTPVEQEFGYLFYHCRFLSDCGKHSVYLSRPWREYAKSVIIDSFIGDHIKSEGYHDWDNSNAHASTYYAEGKNNGDGAKSSGREKWIHILSAEDADDYVKRFMKLIQTIK